MLRKPMPKLKKIGKPAALKIVGKPLEVKADASLKRIYPRARPKFFRAKGTHVLAIGTAPAMGPASFEAVISKFVPEKGLFKKFAKCTFKNTNEGLAIMSVGKILKGGGVNVSKPQKTGFNVFRLFLNEAIAKAKALGSKEILIYTASEKLGKYYEGFGFTPGKPHYKLKVK